MAEYIVPAIAAVLVAIIEAVAARDRRRAKADKEARKRDSLLQLELQMATAKLSYACAVALKRGKANGEVEEGIDAYEAAKKKYTDFLNEQATEHLL